MRRSAWSRSRRCSRPAEHCSSPQLAAADRLRRPQPRLPERPHQQRLQHRRRRQRGLRSVPTPAAGDGLHQGRRLHLVQRGPAPGQAELHAHGRVQRARLHRLPHRRRGQHRQRLRRERRRPTRPAAPTTRGRARRRSTSPTATRPRARRSTASATPSATRSAPEQMAVRRRDVPPSGTQAHEDHHARGTRARRAIRTSRSNCDTRRARSPRPRSLGRHRRGDRLGPATSTARPATAT